MEFLVPLIFQLLKFALNVLMTFRVDTYRHTSYVMGNNILVVIINFINDYSRRDYLYLINEKSQSQDMFKDFEAEVENQISKKIKAIKSSRGDEYYDRYDRLGEQRLGLFTRYLTSVVLSLNTPCQRETKSNSSEYDKKYD